MQGECKKDAIELGRMDDGSSSSGMRVVYHGL